MAGFEVFADFETAARAAFADFAGGAAFFACLAGLGAFPFFAGCLPAFPEAFLRTGAGGLRETGLAAVFLEVDFFEAFTLERDAFAAFVLPFFAGLDALAVA